MSDEALDRALADPEVRARLVAALAATVTGTTAPAQPWWIRYRQFFAGLASGSVVLLAFLIPSLQDQWDRLQARTAIDRYAAIAESLYENGEYASAEQAFEKALELSEGRRIDLLEAKLRAHVARVNENADWLGDVPNDVTESDFMYLLELQRGSGNPRDRAATLAAYGDFLASAGRLSEAESQLQAALALDADNVAALVALGNLKADADDVPAAEAFYRKALAQAPQNAAVVFNLASLLSDAGRCAEAEPILAAGLKDAGRLQSALQELQAECVAARHTEKR